MTNLVQDAMCTEVSVPMKNFTNASRVNPKILQEIANDLDEGEVISIIFLMVDKDTDFSKVIEEVKEDPWAAFTKLASKNAWTEKLLESLLVIGNKYVLGKMGFDKNEIQYMENSFVTKQHNISPFLNKAIKSLYFLCQNLDGSEVQRLVKDGKDKWCMPLDICQSKLYLELYILEWLKQKYISIDPDNFDLSNLLKSLKSVGCLLDLPFHFDDWEKPHPFINKNEQDSEMYFRMSNNESISQSLSSENNPIYKNSDVPWSTPNHKRLCIIVNQVKFTKKYELREGTEVDEKSLEETFKGCGFEIDVRKNLKKQEMIELLESLNNKDKSYSTYGAIFMCILSHGFEGEVVFSDDDSLSISTMEKMFCCRQLQRVFKFLILQSCQGQQIGLVQKLSRQLVSDGPSSSINPLLHMHFGIFKATINDFKAMRHKQEGTWFIQDLCREIKEANRPLEIREFIQNVKTRVTRRTAPSDDKLQQIVQVPISSDTITIPYTLIPNFKKRI